MTMPSFKPNTLLVIERLAFAIQQKTSCMRVLQRHNAHDPKEHQVQRALSKVQRALEKDLYQLSTLLNERN
jgi:hypothetical protein